MNSCRIHALRAIGDVRFPGMVKAHGLSSSLAFELIAWEIQEDLRGKLDLAGNFR